MKLIVGLGNPGPEYEKTRHNAGFMALDRWWARRGDTASVAKSRFSGITRELSLGTERCVLLKPTVYMNLSGRSVAEAVNFFKIDPTKDLLVIVDDVALPTGVVRVRPGGGAGGHNGLRSIQQSISTQAYTRLRIGIDACPPVMALEDYVLGRFTGEQTALLGPAIEKAVEATEVFVLEGAEAAMNKFNGPAEEKPKPPRKPDTTTGEAGEERSELKPQDTHPGRLDEHGRAKKGE
jgi:PTH1 family peptidyl-tRNA hydrolase